MTIATMPIAQACRRPEIRRRTGHPLRRQRRTGDTGELPGLRAGDIDELVGLHNGG